MEMLETISLLQRIKIGEEFKIKFVNHRFKGLPIVYTGTTLRLVKTYRDMNNRFYHVLVCKSPLKKTIEIYKDTVYGISSLSIEEVKDSMEGVLVNDGDYLFKIDKK